MIFYHPHLDFRFSDYGIMIPIVDDRAQKVFQTLQTFDSSLTFCDWDCIPALTREDLELVHDSDFVARLFGSYVQLEKEIMSCYELIDQHGQYHRYQPDSSKKDFTQMFTALLKHAGTTYYSTKNALESGFSYFLGGGMHHAMTFSGRGFCLINDVVISLRKLQKENRIKTAWVIDVDAHKGDGTAEITFHDESIVSLSVHMKTGWPLDSGINSDPWFIPSNIDVAIDVGEENLYLSQLQMALDKLDQTYPRPDVVIIVNGADPFVDDELPSTAKMKLSKEQLLDRDKMIYHFLLERKIPQSYVMSGGYGQKSWEIYTQFLNFVRQDSSIRPKIGSR